MLSIHKELLKKNINDLNIKNIKIGEGSFIKGCKDESPFDRIIIDSPVNNINEEELFSQLSENSGKIIMIRRINENLSHAVKITKNSNNFSEEYLFDVFSNYTLYEDEKRFVF